MRRIRRALRFGAGLARFRIAIRIATATALLIALLLCAWRSPMRFRLIDRSRFTRPGDSLHVVDRHDAPLRYERVDGIDRRWVSLSNVSPYLAQAFVAVEDHRFWRHDGVDLRSVLRALVGNVLPGHKRSGASTITQQVVKLVYGRPAGYLTKVVEILRALVLEEVMTKEEILEQYVNRVPYGDQIEGVARASEAYFGCPVSNLTAAQAAMLAGIPQAPSVTEPRRHLPRALARRRVVLEAMLSAGSLDPETFDLAVAETAMIRPNPPRPYEAPRFVDGVLSSWRKGNMVLRDGTLQSSLDLTLQHRSEDILRTAVQRWSDRGVHNGAAVVVANATGEVLAYVAAARRGPDAPGGQMDLLLAPRQPGSTLKPFVYAQLFERGGTAATLLDDMSRPMTGAAGVSFEVRDFDGGERGPVRARVALASSLNLAAVEAARRVGADALVSRLRALGFARVRGANVHGAAIVLGGADVTAWELARAYTSFARGGRLVEPTRVRGAVPVERAVFKPEAATVITDILSDAEVRSEAFGDDLRGLSEGRRFALKTGTSTGFRDAWAVVYDELHTVVVWLGDPGGDGLRGVSGFEAAAPVAAAVLAGAHERAEANGVRPHEHAEVALLAVDVCADTGLRAGPRCRRSVLEHFARGTVPRRGCIAHDASGAVRLAAHYDAWFARTRPSGMTVSREGAVPDGHVPVVRSPRDGASLLLERGGEHIDIPLRATAGGALVKDVTWQIDGRRLAGADWRPAPGDHEIVAEWRGRRSRGVRVHVEVSGGVQE